MSNDPWTPGPWRQDGTEVRTQQGTIARIPAVPDGGVFDRMDNARLIAAAPELAEALERLAMGDPLVEDDLPFIDPARELLARIRFAETALSRIRGEA